MADTAYDEVCQHGQFREDIQYAVTEDDAVVLYQGVAYGATSGYITSTTVATDGRLAGFAQQSVTAAQTDYTGDGAAGVAMPIFRIPVMIHGSTRFMCGANTSVTYGMWQVLEGTDGRLVDAGATSNTLYVTHGIAQDDPDADGEWGHIIINLNVPYYSATT